jgi:hypothetical protein
MRTATQRAAIDFHARIEHSGIEDRKGRELPRICYNEDGPYMLAVRPTHVKGDGADLDALDAGGAGG